MHSLARAHTRSWSGDSMAQKAQRLCVGEGFRCLYVSTHPTTKERAFSSNRVLIVPIGWWRERELGVHCGERAGASMLPPKIRPRVR